MLIEMTEDSRCKAKFSMINGEIHRCDLYDGHEGNHHTIIEWTKEESEYEEGNKECTHCGKTLGPFERDVCGPCRMKDPKFKEELDE